MHPVDWRLMPLRKLSALTTLVAIAAVPICAGALAAPAARAQQPPAGTGGFVAFTAPFTLTLPADSLMAIDLNGVPDPFPQGGPASTALAVNIPLNANGTNLIAARAQQRRGMQAPREAELAPVFSAGNPLPAIFIPAEDTLGFGFVTSVDFRGVFPTTNTAPIALNGRGVPYEILRHSTLPLVYYTTTNPVTGNLIVVEVNYTAIGAPSVTATYPVAGPPTRYATRLTESGSGQVVIPWAR